MSFHTEIRVTVFGAMSVVKRHWRRGLLFFLAVMVVTVCGLIFCPRTYLSESSLFVGVGRESVCHSTPRRQRQPRSRKNESRENEINSIKDMLVVPPLR